MKKKSLLFAAIILSLVFSCKKDKTTSDTHDVGYGYYQGEVGKYIEYEVDSTVYDDFEHDTDYYRYRLKEVVESIFTDNAGRPTLRLERYIKMYNPALSYDSIPWALRDVWAANITNTTVEKTEENVKFLKLSFPVSAGKTWNGNAFNTLGEQTYTYTDVDKPRGYNGFSFDSTLMVTQQDELNLILKKYYIEVFAKGVGLVHKQSFDIYSGTVTAVPVTSRIQKGVDYKMTVVKYGTE